MSSKTRDAFAHHSYQKTEITNQCKSIKKIDNFHSFKLLNCLVNNLIVAFFNQKMYHSFI